MDPQPPPQFPPTEPGSDKTLAILCHISIFLGVGFILPLIVFLLKRDESPLVAAHAKEVLNFHLSLLIYSVCTLPLFLVLFCLCIPIYIALALMGFICAIIGAVQASEGRFYFYPLTIRLIT